MSFGFAVSDFLALGKLAWGLYKQCKGASAEFAEVCNEVLSIHTALRELEDEAQNEDSILNRAGKSRQKELRNIVQNCTEVLTQLEALVTRYRSLGTSQKRVWDRIKFGDEGIQVIRNKLVLHTSTLTLFLTSLGTGSLGRIEKKLDEIAAEVRAGRHEPSVMTAVNDDTGSSQREAWGFLFGELADDFSRDEIEAYKGEIKTYIKQLMDQGALKEQEDSVRSDERPTHSSSPRPLSPAATDSEPGPSSSASAAHPDSNWLPRPTAISVSGSESSDHAVSPLQTESQAETEPLLSTANESSTHRAGTLHNAAATNSSSLSNAALTTREDDGLLDKAKTKARDTNRWGERCFITIEIGHDCCRVAAYDFILQKPIFISDETGVVDMPTCVAFTEDEVLVGSAAKQQAAENSPNTFSGFTSLLDRDSSHWDEAELEYKSCECDGLRKRGNDLMIFVPCRRRHYTLVHLTGILLQSCKQLAEAHCGGTLESFQIAIVSCSFTMQAIAAAAEICGIPDPKNLPFDLALAWSVATQKHLCTKLDKPNIVVIEASTRACSVSSVHILSSLGKPSKVRADLRCRVTYGASIDQLYFVDQIYPHFHLTNQFRRMEKWRTIHLLTKHIGMLVEAVRKDLVGSGEASRHIPILWSDREFVLLSDQVETSRIVFPPYVQHLQRNLEKVTGSGGMPDICVLTGEVSCLESVQSLVQGFFADHRCHIILATSDEALSSSRGAVDLTLRGVTIREQLDRQLGLLVSDDEGNDRYLELCPWLGRGQDLNPWVKSIRVSPTSTAQAGLFIAVYESKSGTVFGDFCSRELLLEVAIDQKFAAQRWYTLQVSVDREYNIDFELRRDRHDSSPEYFVRAHIHCSNTGVVDLREGKFLGVNDDRRKNWRLKEYRE